MSTPGGGDQPVVRGTPLQRIRAALVAALVAVLGHLPASVVAVA